MGVKEQRKEKNRKEKKLSCFPLQEMVENMDSTRDVWAMQLDTIRNRIIRVELLVAVASFSLMMSTVPASFFGMNLTSGLEVIPNSHLVVSLTISFHERSNPKQLLIYRLSINLLKLRSYI